MKLTVAICTYNRPEPLRAALASLCDCEPVDVAWELLVVDNQGDDQVRGIVESFADRLTLRYVVEPMLGTSHARNRAVRESTAPIVLFTDDDVTFERDWLQRMVAAIREHDECALWGGRVEPVFPPVFDPPPKWYAPQLCPSMADMIVQYRPSQQPRAWHPQHDAPFYTANLALRVEAMEAVGLFDTSVGHRGGLRMGMEDSLMVRAIAQRGGRGWYAADAVVNHPVPAERMTKQYALQFARRQGALSAELVREDGRVPKWIVRDAAARWCAALRRSVAGALSFDVAKRFAGRYQMAYQGSRLKHALSGKPPGGAAGRDTADVKEASAHG